MDGARRTATHELGSGADESGMSADIGRRIKQLQVLRGAAMALTALSIVVVSLLMGAHVPFATGTGGPAWRRANGRWQAVYVLGEKCPCSSRVARHLMDRGPAKSIEEHILQVGDEPETEAGLRRAGWVLWRRAPEVARDEYGALSAPLLVIVDPRGEIRYRGGLSRRSDARDGFHEQEIWTALQQGREVKQLPAYGCALRFGCEWGGLEQVLAR